MSIAKYNAGLPENINQIIHSKGLKQGVVAIRAGFSSQQFSDMLNGRRIIKPCDALAIAKALNVEISEIYEHKQNSA